jgi:hypothetical protein
LVQLFGTTTAIISPIIPKKMINIKSIGKKKKVDRLVIP